MGKLRRSIPQIDTEVRENTEYRHWHDNLETLEKITEATLVTQDEIDFLRQYTYMVFS